jgi:hypothetical protein
MKKTTPLVIVTFMSLLSLSSLFFVSCTKESERPADMPVVKPDLVFYGLSGSGQLSKFNAMNASSPLSTITISGLQTAESILAIDFRPATGELYALGSSSRLYIINTVNGTTRMVGTDPFIPALTGDIAGFDFNPTVDRIRVVTGTGQNLRINPETGVVVATDGNINGITGASVNAVAYTNSMAGASATSLFDIDPTTQMLYKQSPPNNGTLVLVGSLGVMASGEGGFDISPDNAVALAALTVSGKSSLFKIDTATGAAIKLGDFPTSDAIKAIAIPTNPVAYAVDETNNLLIFNPTKPGAPVMKAITGTTAGDMIEALDFRPLNGQLYVLGKSGSLYTINASSGAATAVGTMPFGTLTGSYYGFDFNPTVDRIRLISNAGQNLRLHPVTGVIAFTDANLNPGTPNVSGAAYANNFAGATTTTLYDIDCAADKLYKQMPPNDGTLVEVGLLGINIESANGFDIGSTSGMAFGIFTVSGSTGIYSVSLSTGAATKVSDFPVKAKGFTLGLGF